VHNRHHAGCRIAVERAADQYTLICDVPLWPAARRASLLDRRDDFERSRTPRPEGRHHRTPQHPLSARRHGPRAADDEYGPEFEDFAHRIVECEPITPELLATVWHHWLGDRSDEPQLTSGREALAVDLQTIQSGSSWLVGN